MKGKCDDTEERLRQQAETFISSLTNLITRPLNRIRYRNQIIKT